MAESLSTDDVREIARLSRLQVSDAEVESLRGELSAILEHMDALRSINTAGVEPMTHAVPMTLRMRVDDVGESLPADKALESAPVRADGYFQVPNILSVDTGG